MARLIMFTGGARSGKSRLAQERLLKFTEVAYIATAQALDEEMRQRVALHKAARPSRWHTLEASLDLSAALRHAFELNPSAILIDCLTLWLSNYMLKDWHEGWDAVNESAILDNLQSALEFVINTPKEIEVVVVSNEVGCGIVPDNAMARAFRDLSGRANQVLSAACAEVYFVTAGLPLKLK